MGRPKSGYLSTYPEELVSRLRQIRQSHSGWGADSLLLALQEQYGYTNSALPSIASVNRYLKQEGLIPVRPKRSTLPQSQQCSSKVKRVHAQWEMDAKGPQAVVGLGTCAAINIKDRKSKVYCMTLPVPVKNSRSQPKSAYYYWALRLAFEKWGLPKSIRVDHDSVFYENQSPSPFPRPIHLWLIGLGVELCFIKRKPPAENATVERSHQTINKQVYQDQQYDCWKDLLYFGWQRIEKLNWNLPCKTLQGKAPLKKFPQAIHSKREYAIDQEHILIDLKQIYSYLAKGEWFRDVSKDKTISLGGQVYYLKQATKQSQLQIRFCNRKKKLLFHDVNERCVACLPIKRLTVQNLMGASSKDLKKMRYLISQRRDCPIKT